MTLPTSGFTTNTIRYTLSTEGDYDFPVTIEVKASLAIAEDIADALDTNLVALANDLESITGITAVHVYKSFVGATSQVDIA